ncbi:543_t:CDS:2, partial [Cetraspora pellucida]
TTDIIWSVLGFENQKEILMNDEKSIEQIISEVVKKYNDETDLKLFKLTDKYNPDFKRPSLTDFANGKFQPVKKDICAPLLKIEKEQAEQFLEVIYNENLKGSRQITLIDLWSNVEKKLLDLKIITNKKKRKQKEPDILIPKRNRIDYYFQKKN